MIQRGKLASLLVPSTLLVMVTVLHSCMTFRMSPKEIDRFFSEKKLQGSQLQYSVGTRTIHYVVSGDTTKPVVIFVHGSPGSLSAFIDFMADTVLLQISADEDPSRLARCVKAIQEIPSPYRRIGKT